MIATVAVADGSVYNASMADKNLSGEVSITPKRTGSAKLTVTVPESTNYQAISKECMVTITNGTIGGSVSISGTTRFTQTLSAVTSSVTPAGCSFTYQWYTNSTNSTSGGSAISGATNSTLALDDPNYVGNL